MCACTSLCLQAKQGGVSQNVLCARPCLSARFWWATSFRGEFEGIVVACDSLHHHLLLHPNPSRLRQHLFSLFLMSCLYVCLIISCFSTYFFFLLLLLPNCIILKNSVIYSLSSCTIAFYRLSHIVCVTAVLSAFLDQLHMTYRAGPPSVLLEVPSSSCLVWHIGSLWSCESAPEDFSLFLFLSGQADATPWGSVQDYAAGKRWQCTDAGKLVMWLLHHR